MCTFKNLEKIIKKTSGNPWLCLKNYFEISKQHLVVKLKLNKIRSNSEKSDKNIKILIANYSKLALKQLVFDFSVISLTILSNKRLIFQKVQSKIQLYVINGAENFILH